MSAAHHVVVRGGPPVPALPPLGTETTPRPLLRARLAQRTMLHSYQVPAMRPEFCTKRLICMEYCPGVKISDTDELERQGFDQALPTMLPT